MYTSFRKFKKIIWYYKIFFYYLKLVSKNDFFYKLLKNHQLFYYLNLEMSSNKSINVTENCFAIRTVGVYMLALLLASTFFNIISMWIFYKAKLFTPINFFMMTLLSLNLIATYIEAPYMMYNAYNCK